MINTKQKHSWLANYLLSLRDTIFPWMKIAVGNGETTYFWTSNWSPFGNIRNYLQGEGPRHFGIPPMTTLAELWKDDNWNLPPARSERQVNIQTFLTTISLSHARDEYSWEPNDNVSNTYSARRIYDFVACSCASCVLAQRGLVLRWNSKAQISNLAICSGSLPDKRQNGFLGASRRQGMCFV